MKNNPDVNNISSTFVTSGGYLSGMNSMHIYVQADKWLLTFISVVSLYIQKEVTEQEADFIDSAFFFIIIITAFILWIDLDLDLVYHYRYSVSVSLCCFRAY